MADIRAEDLTQETKATLDGSEQFIMFDSTQGKRGSVAEVGDYILQNGDADGDGDTVSEIVEGKQDKLTSGTNIKTINGTSVLGSGNISIQSGDTVTVTRTQTSGNQIGSISVNGTPTTLYSKAETDPVFSASAAAEITSADLDTWDAKQDALVSGTNIKTINNQSLLGSGNITIEGGGGGGGGADQNIWYGTSSTASSTAAKVVTTTTGDFTLTTGNMVRVTFSSGNTATATLNVDGTGAKSARMVSTSSATAYYWASGETVDFVYNGTYFLASGKGTATTSYYGVTKLSSSTSSTSTSLAATPSAVKSAYDLANEKQAALVSGTNIKTVNGESILGSGDIETVTKTTVTISAADWNATTTCTKSVTGVTSSNAVTLAPAPADFSTWASNGVLCTAQGSGTLTFTADTTPASSITVNLLIHN